MLKTFRIGGIHPPENKLSKNKAIENIPLPKQVVVFLSQHLGAPAVPVVQKGDEVKVGSLLAKSGGFVSANTHSPVSGKIQKIDSTADSSGYKRPAAFIDVEGDVWEKSIDRTDHLVKDCTLSPKEIIDKIAAAGIVGMGGATFPTQVKLFPPQGMKAEVLIINGVECEPYLTSDHALMLEKGDEIMVGISILMKATGVNRAIIGIENNKKDAIELFRNLSDNYPGISVEVLKVQYPQGGEKQLIDTLIRRQVPSGGLPVAVGAIVQNVATAYAVYEAVQKNKPLIERVVTLTGKRIAKPCNVWARIGTSVCELIDFAGGLPDDTAKIVGGGPMMGKALVNAEVPIGKGSSGILLMPSFETQRKEMRNCIRCTKCVSVCPMGLAPNYLMNVVEFGEWELAAKMAVSDCIECGSCSYVCPANRPLLDYIRLGKSTVMKKMKK